MRSTSYLAAFVLAMPVLAQAQTEPVNLVKNGSFEATVLASGSQGSYARIEGWTADRNQTIELRHNLVGTAFDGKNFAELDAASNSTMRQSVLGFTVGETYTLSFAYANRPGTLPATNGLAWSLGGGVWTDLATPSHGPSRDHQWQQFSTTFVANAATVGLSFRALGISDAYGSSLDAVSITRLTSPVPEPSTLAMLLAGLGVVGLMVRRRSSLSTSH
ncbi:PEP-CTERM sorting domain-containing protein [Roseateles sp. BYS180W]|uniref:PEP-CTERM sorting domain-containing protein n=1 Tax=Roseateles rivi TaxID=3299028 RepID=A0ABW7FWR3_9BURK